MFQTHSVNPITSFSISVSPIPTLFHSLSKSISFNPRTAFPSITINSNKNPNLKYSNGSLRCSVSAIDEIALKKLQTKPSPAEVSRTIMELCSQGTLSTLIQEGWPLGTGVRFAVDAQGMPILCLNTINRQNPFLSMDQNSSLHVQLEQSGSRTPQCTLQGKLSRPGDGMLVKKLQSIWTKRFEEELEEDLIYVVAVERVLQMEDFEQDGTWVAVSEYRNAIPDPLRSCAEMIVDEMNDKNMEDIHRFCNIYVDLGFQVTEARMIWIDRLGFDLHLRSPQREMLEVRIPFPREVTDEKGAKSSLVCMSQLAWEIEKNYTVPEFEKIKCLRKLR